MRVAVVTLALAVACKSTSSEAPKAIAVDEPPPEAAPPALIDPPAMPGAMAPRLVADGDGALLTWIEPLDASVPRRERVYRMRMARFGGGNWSDAATIVESAKVIANWADAPSVTRGGDGALVAHWAQASAADPHAYDVAIARSTDDGDTWVPLGLAHRDATASEHGFVSMVATADGVRAFWLDGRATAGEHGGGPMALRTAAIGESIGDDAEVDQRVCDCCGTDAAATSKGPIVAYRDRSDDETRDIAVARIGATGREPIALAGDGWRIPGCPVNGPALAADGDRAAVAWYTYANDAPVVKVAFYDAASDRFGPPIAVDASSGRNAPVGRVDVALTGDAALVSWISSDREDATIRVRRVAPSGEVGEPVVVAATTPQRDAGFPALAVVGDDAVIAWTEVGEPSRLRAKKVPLDAFAAASDAPVAPAPASSLLAIGAAAPDYATTDLDGKRVTLARYGRRKPVLVNLWATWCEPCRHELPALAAVHEQFAGRGLRIVGVSVDRVASTDEVRAFAQRRNIPFAVWHDAKDQASAVFGAQVLPTTLLFDANKTLIWRHVGAIDAADPELRTAIESALDR